MYVNELNQYIIELDDIDKRMIRKRVVEKGIEGYLSQQLFYLDCTRIAQNMRFMQTIGYPYCREISCYLYALYIFAQDNAEFDKVWTKKLLERHAANIEYEKDNPPIWYGGKKAKDKWDKEHGKKLPRRKKSIDDTLHGMGKEISNKEKLKKLSAQFGNLTFKIKPPKKD